MTLQPQLPPHIQSMLAPSFYGYSDSERPESVKLLQTQMSFVLLAGDNVYKIKKPVNLGYLDYTTLERREFYCRRELNLNRRLCSRAYLDVVRISRVGKGFTLGDGDEVVDYAVRMRYLPQNRMLNVLLETNEVPTDVMDRIAARIADFHGSAETSSVINAFGSMDTLRRNTEENFDQTGKYIGRTISAEKYKRIREYTRSYLESNPDLFLERVEQGKIRDCHGDLHAAHICIMDEICIYDCIEFNDRFRYGDVASEVAFLAMDLDHYGRADLSRRFISTYVERSGDRDVKKLLPFYKCYRAYVRGKVEGFRLDDPFQSEDDKKRASQTARGYFDLSSFYVRPKPVLFVTVGVTGTGKSTLAAGVAKRTGANVISSDVVRKGLAAVPLKEHHFEEFRAGIYSDEFSRRTYDKMFALAAEALAFGQSVVLDATFIKKADRLRAVVTAEENGADLLLLECKLNEDTIREWLAQRSRAGSVSDGREEILEPQMKQYEPLTDIPPEKRITLDMTQPLNDRVDQVLERLGET